MFGQWPPEEFAELDKDEQEAFWRTKADTPEDVEKLVVDTIAKRIIEREMQEYSGEYQPLAYWARLGYDPDRIKEHTPEKMRKYFPQLGECYKVVIQKESFSTTVEKVREQLARRKRELVKRPRPSFLEDFKDADKGKAGVPQGAPKLPKKPKKDDSSSDSSDNDGRSAAAAAKKAERKAAKKQRKLDMERKKADRQQEVEQKRSIKLVNSTSNKVISRCQPIIVSLERDIGDSCFSNIPSIVQKKAKGALSDLKGHANKANEKLAQANPVPWGDEFKDKFDAEIKAWAEVASLVSAQLSAVKQAGI